MIFRRNIELLPGLAPSSGDLPHMDEPYITCVDAEQEFVVIYNPSNEYFPLDHYSIADGKMHHTFKFPRRCKIPPRSEYCIYTCPGAPGFDHGSLMEYHVLWTNHDGSLRRMEVLNNDKCCVKLLNPKGEIISQCEAGMENPQAAARRRLHEYRNTPFYKMCERAQITLLYVRIPVLVGMVAACVGHAAVCFVTLFWIAMACDLLSRPALGKDPVLTSIALLGDRMTTLVLIGSLLFLLNTTQHNAVSDYQDAPEGEGLSTPAIRLGAIAYYITEQAAVDNSTAPEPVAAKSAMAWVGMMVPGLSRRTLFLSLLLELLAVLLNPSVLLSPREVHSYGSRTPDEEVTSEIQEDELEVQEQVLHTARGKEVEVQDLYAFLGQLSPVLLAVVGVAADYYALHCFTSYHFKYELDGGEGGTLVSLTPPSSPWLYDLWVMAAALGCVAFNVKLVNNASLVGSAVMRLIGRKK